MDRDLPPPAAPDWHVAVRLSVYPERSSLAVVHYRLLGNADRRVKYLLQPQEYERPDNMWDVYQQLQLGIERLAGKYYP